MSILRKPLAEITIDDLENLITAGARETGELEFKGTLPFQPQKGQPQTADRWIEKGDRIGDYARDEILAELTAFANAERGTLVLGLHETTDDPRRAERLDPLPNCEGHARRILDASEDIVEPRLRVQSTRRNFSRPRRHVCCGPPSHTSWPPRDRRSQARPEPRDHQGELLMVEPAKNLFQAPRGRALRQMVRQGLNPELQGLPADLLVAKGRLLDLGPSSSLGIEGGVLL
jgi:hypothetical protein